MKQMLLIRHAKSGYRHEELVDFARTLNSEGRIEAVHLSKEIAALGFSADRILCSPAVRTVQTLHFLIRAGICTLEDVSFVPELYLATPTVIYEAYKQSGGNQVMVIGHNPGISELASQLVKNTPIIQPLPTAGWHLLSYQKTWKKIGGTI